jgi:hypothetical protein
MENNLIMRRSGLDLSGSRSGLLTSSFEQDKDPSNCLNFSSGAKSLYRQQPDVMVNEV